MNTLLPPSAPVEPVAGPGVGPTVVINRVTERLWHALEDDQVVGRGDAIHRPDGRMFISIDAWHETVFRLLAAAMLRDLPRPLYTVVDEADSDQTASWLLADFSIARRECGYLVPTDPRVTGFGAAGLGAPSFGAAGLGAAGLGAGGLGAAGLGAGGLGAGGLGAGGLGAGGLGAGVTIIPAGMADEAPLRALDRAIRDEIAATVGWQTMPAEVIALPSGDTVVDPSKYAVAAQGSDYVGLLRLATVTRQPRIGLLAVRADYRRRGIGRALLAHTLNALHRSGTAAAWAEVNESNVAATALFEAAGARPANRNLELVHI